MLAFRFRLEGQILLRPEIGFAQSFLRQAVRMWVLVDFFVESFYVKSKSLSQQTHGSSTFRDSRETTAQTHSGDRIVGMKIDGSQILFRAI